MPYRKRICFIFFSISIFITALTLKMFWLQIINKDRFVQGAIARQTVSVPVEMKRGLIFDRSMIPLVENEAVDNAVVFPEIIKDKKKAAVLLRQLVGKSFNPISLENNNPFLVKAYNKRADLIKKLEALGIGFFPVKERYGAKCLARHIVGYASKTTLHGVSGIEKIFDESLFDSKQSKIGLFTDVYRTPVEGVKPQYINPGKDSECFNVRLTLDYHIQSIVEKVMDKRVPSGAVVVEDVTNGDILAVASRPQYDQKNVAMYLNSKNGELLNRAFEAYNPGSVFKIVTMAAALEKDMLSLSHNYYCAGGYYVNNKWIKCSKKHEQIDLEKAFVYSCNSAFIQLGLKTGNKAITEMAKRLGLGQETEITECGFKESNGNIPLLEYSNRCDTANIAIGQGGLMVTPIQVVSMVSTIANNGIRNRINLVDAIVSDEGKDIKKIRRQQKKRVLSFMTAIRIQDAMEKVVTEGTGMKANITKYAGSAGKTGTAQSGWRTGNKTKIHAWFAGYFPISKPKYAVVVLIENGQSGGNNAAPVFGEIASEIEKLGKR